MANGVDPDQTAPLGAVDLSLHCLTRPICPKTWDCYSNLIFALHDKVNLYMIYCTGFVLSDQHQCCALLL